MPPEIQHTVEFVTLRDYIDMRFAVLDNATQVAYQAMERRLDSMNEFRDTLKDQNSTFITKAEFLSYKDKVDGDLRVLRESKAQLEGKASQSAVNVSLIISILGLLLGILSLILRFVE